MKTHAELSPPPRAVTATAATPRARGELWLLLAILALTGAAFAPGVRGELVYDDRLLIGRNPLITDLANLPRLFVSGYWDFLGDQKGQFIGYWRPLTAIVQALLWPIAGSAPLPYHVASIAIHLGATAAAFLLVRSLTASAWLAGATALFFGLHPAHVESVAWISALNDPLFGCLALFALERFVAWRRRGSHGIPLVATLAFGLALLAKELGAALVPLLVIVDVLRPRAAGEPEVVLELPESAPRRLREALSAFRLPLAPTRAYGPFALVFAMYLGARMLVFESPWAGFDRTTTDFAVGALRLVLLRVELFGGGLEVLCFPIHLNLFRPFRPYIEPFDPALVRAAVYTALFAALVAGAFLARQRTLLTALLVIPAGLLPALIRVESLGVFPLSERFLYLPVFGFALALALGLQRWLPRRWAGAAVLVVAGLYVARVVERTRFWRDEETLFRRAAADSPRSVYVQWGLGRVLLELANSKRDPRYVREAFDVYERAQDLLIEAKREPTDLMVSSSDYLQVNLGLAWCYLNEAELGPEGGAATAVALLDNLVQQIERIEREESEARELGVRVREHGLDVHLVYAALGVAHSRSGDFAEAERAFHRALELDPRSPETHQNFGRTYAAQGRWQEAASEFEAASRERPGNVEDRLLLAQALETLGQHERAEALAHDLVSELPGRAEPLVVLATAAQARGDTAQAIAWLERALAIDPKNALAWYQKARALLARGEDTAAVSAFRNATELDPLGFEAHYDFGAYLLGQGYVAEARPLLVRAYTVAPAAHRAPLREALGQMELDEPAELRELARADTKRNEDEAAAAWIERLLVRVPDDREALLLLARSLRRLHRDAEAAEKYRRLSELFPADFEVWSELGRTLQVLERKDEAHAALQRALELGPPKTWPEGLQETARKSLQALIEGRSPGEAIDVDVPR